MLGAPEANTFQNRQYLAQNPTGLTPLARVRLPISGFYLAGQIYPQISPNLSGFLIWPPLLFSRVLRGTARFDMDQPSSFHRQGSSEPQTEFDGGVLSHRSCAHAPPAPQHLNIERCTPQILFWHSMVLVYGGLLHPLEKS